MISMLEASNYYERLHALRWMPTDEEAMRTILDYFAAHVEDAAHAERVIAKMLAENNEWPGPQTFMQVIVDTSAAAQARAAEPAQEIERARRAHVVEIRSYGKCPQCSNFGNFTGPDGTLRRCTCKYATPQLVGNVMWNSDAWLAQSNEKLRNPKTAGRARSALNVTGVLRRV